MPKVLVVDDKVENREVLINLFRAFGMNSGIEISEASSGKEAFEKIKTEKPDLVFMDVNMETPEAGLEVTRKVRLDPELKDIKIWAVTAQAMEGQDGQPSDKDKSIQAGCNDFIAKPFDLVDMIKRISKTLQIEVTKRMKVRLGLD